MFQVSREIVDESGRITETTVTATPEGIGITISTPEGDEELTLTHQMMENLYDLLSIARIHTNVTACNPE
jgi:hypothetical protein